MSAPAVFEIKVLADLAAAASQFTGFTQQLKGVEGAVQGVSNSLKSFGTFLSGGILGGLAAMFATSHIKEYMAEAGAAIRAQKELANALAQRGQFSQEYLHHLNELAEAQQRQLGVSEDEITQTQRALIQRGATRETIEGLTKATLDYAAAQRMDALSAVMMVGRAMTSETTSIRGVRGEIEKNSSALQRQQQIVKMVDAQFGGSAATMNTGTKQVSLAMHDLDKAIGEVFVRIKGAYYKEMADGIYRGADAVKAFVKDNQALFGTAASVATAIGKLVGDNFKLTLTLGALTAATISVTAAVAAFGTFLAPIIGTVAVAVLALTGLVFAVNNVGRALGLWDFVTPVTNQIGQLQLAGTKVGDWARMVKDVLVAAFDFVKASGIAIFQSAEETLVSLLRSAIDKLGTLAKAAVMITSPLGGLLGGVVIDKLKQSALAALPTDKEIKDRGDKADAAMLDAGVRLVETTKKLGDKAAAAASAAGKKLFAPPSPTNGAGGDEVKKRGDDAKNAAKAIDEGAEAEKRYRMLIDETNNALKVGDITQAQATAQNRATTAAYLADLQRQQQGLSRTSDKWHELQVRILAARAAAQNMTVWGQVTARLRELRDQLGDIGKNIGEFFTSQITGAIDTLANGLANLLVRGGSVKEMFVSLWQSAVAGLIKFGLQLVAHYALSAALKLAGAATSVTANTAVAASAGVAGLLESIATYGANAGEGASAFGEAVGMGMAMIAGFREGGFTGYGRDSDRAGDVHFNEFVYSAPAVRRIGRANLEAHHRAALSSSPSSGGGGGSGGGGSSRASRRRDRGDGDTHFHMISSPVDFARAITRDAGASHVLVDHQGRVLKRYSRRKR